MIFIVGSLLGVSLTIGPLKNNIKFNVILKEFIISSFIFYIVIRYFNKMYGLTYYNYNSSSVHPASL